MRVALISAAIALCFLAMNAAALNCYVSASAADTPQRTAADALRPAPNLLDSGLRADMGFSGRKRA